MTKMVPIASIAFLLAFTLAAGGAEAGPGAGRLRPAIGGGIQPRAMPAVP